MKKIILITLLSIISFSSLFSQPHRMRKQRKEFIDKERIPFFTNYLNLSTEEAEKFWPLYNEYLNKKENLFNEMRSLKQKIKRSNHNITKAEAEEINKKYISIQEKQLNLLKEYNEKFKKILPLDKVNRIYFAEREFRKYLLKQMGINSKQ